MPEIKSLQLVEPPYFPFKGVNADSNGLAIDAEECVMAMNLDILPTSCKLRAGCVSLTPAAVAANPTGAVGLPEEDVLHMEEFKHPDGTLLLFAFTDRDIYFYDRIAGWRTCIDIDLFEGHLFNNWSTTNVIDSELGATILACGSWINQDAEKLTKGEERLLCYFDQESGLFQKFELKLQVPVVEEETGLSYPATNAASLSFQGLSLEILDTSKWAVFATYPKTTIKVSMTSVVGGTVYPVVTYILKDEDGVEVTVLDTAVECNITLTGTIDSTASDCESVLSADAIIKQVLKVNSSSFSTKLTAESQTQFVASVSGVVTASTPLAFNSTVTDFISIVPKTFTISLGTGEGIIAQAGTVVENLPVGKVSLGDASDGASIPCYRLIPTNFEIAAYDTSCYIRVDGLEWQIKILRPSYAGASLLVNYDYYIKASYKPCYISTYHNALLLGNTYEDDSAYYPWRLRWTETNTVTIIKYSSYQDFLQKKLSKIISIVTLNTTINNEASGFLYVLLSDFIYRGKYDANLFVVFETAYLEGMFAPKTLVEADSLLYYLGNNDIYVFDGLVRKSITKNPNNEQTRVRNFIYSDLDFASSNTHFAVYDKGRRRILFYLKQKTNIYTYPTRVAVYQIDSKMWYFYTVPETSFALSVLGFYTNTPIIALEGTIGGLIGTIADQSTAPYLDVVIAAMTKEVYAFVEGAYRDKIKQGTYENITGYLITRDFIGASLENPDRTQRVQIESKGSPYDVAWSGDYTLKPSEFEGTTTMPESRKFKVQTYNPDVTHYHIRFLLTGTSTEFIFRWLQVYRMRQEITND